MTEALVIGAGPAGLMAAQMLCGAGHQVVIAEAKPSPARKFLMAGKSGLNLTKDEPADRFETRYDAGRLAPMLAEFGPDQVQAWAHDLGQEIYTGSSRRVFPKAMKASPLLRAWMARLATAGAELRTSWRWTGWEGDGFAFQTPKGLVALRPKITVLALGGASWARLGSDAAWVPWLTEKGVAIAPFRPSNMGFNVGWSPHMARHFGQPVKGVALLAGAQRERGEFIVSAKGVEGGGIYSVSAAVRDGAPLRLDLLPDLTLAQVTTALDRPQRKNTVANWLRKTQRLDPVKIALLQEWGRPLPKGPALAALIKALPVRHSGPLPMDEAISSAGGVSWQSVDDHLQLVQLPHVYACGEMLDWEAPTGGYLITACLATGRWAGRAAANSL